MYLTINDTHFNDLIAKKNAPPMMVVFTADWLGEGTIMDTIVEQLSEEYEDQFGFYRIDVDESKDITHQLGIGIRRLPSIYFFDKGEMIDQFVGIKPKHLLQQRIENLIESPN